MKAHTTPQGNMRHLRRIRSDLFEFVFGVLEMNWETEYTVH